MPDNKDNAHIDPFGFREYDARWLFPESINEDGIMHVGKGFGTQVLKKVKNPTIIVGHDYRSYSEEVKSALKKGLIKITTSIDAGTPETFKFVRGRPKFLNVFENLSRYAKVDPKKIIIKYIFR